MALRANRRADRWCLRLEATYRSDRHDRVKHAYHVAYPETMRQAQKKPQAKEVSYEYRDLCACFERQTSTPRDH
jgi:hypothetical protein